METACAIYKLAQERILLMDGAVGTYLRSIDDSEMLPDIYNITRPELVARVHNDYIHAGADIITTNTINANSLTREQGYMSADLDAVNRAGVKIVRKCIDQNTSQRNIFCAGSVGPTIRNIGLSNKDHYDQLVGVYCRQIEPLVTGGVDILLLETMINLPNAKAALDAAGKVFAKLKTEIPVWLSFAYPNRSGTPLSGEEIGDIIRGIVNDNLIIVGVNCIDDFEGAKTTLKSIKDHKNLLLSFYPNAGLPDEQGSYPLKIEDWVEQIGEICREGLLNIVGGCCGTTPEYIERIAKHIGNFSPRPFMMR